MSSLQLPVTNLPEQLVEKNPSESRAQSNSLQSGEKPFKQDNRNDIKRLNIGRIVLKEAENIAHSLHKDQRTVDCRRLHRRMWTPVSKTDHVRFCRQKYLVSHRCSRRAPLEISTFLLSIHRQ